ncbi:MAG: IscS subfamily cysteine desulfurase [Actinomycetia bacterium]|nr:IscS subfamily cysteine desulfurase [Actinomycetes bacterium]
MNTEPSSMDSALTTKSGICGICPAGCWVDVGVRDGKLETIAPTQGHPLGMLCRRGEHAPEIVYSQDRLRHPLKRTGPKGSHEFERISWDEAYDVIVENLERISTESGPEATAVYTGRGAFELSLCDMYQPREAPVSSASNVLFPFGSPNTMGVGALCYVSFAIIAPHVTMGRMLIDMFNDVENAEMLIVWGTNPATDSPPLDMQRLAAASARGADIVVIDPRRTETVGRTNAQWVPIRPGTDTALALSLIGVLIDEDLHDEDFAENWCHGFDELASYVQHFSPEVGEAITGVPAATIRDLARRLAAASGACPVMYTGLEYSNSGTQAVRAVYTLFALAGQLDVPGGIGLAMLDTQFPINRSCNQPNPDVGRAIGFDKFPLYSSYRGEGHASALVDSVLDGDPYPIRALIVHGASILTSWPQTPIWEETLSKLDFVVCVDRTLTADARYADVVLPATTMFEIDSYMTYGPIFRLRDRIIEPVGEARNDYLIMAELARRLGYGDAFPATENEMIRQVLDGSGFTLEAVREAGGWVKLTTPMMEYKKWQKGGLRRDGSPGFDTPTGKFEIWSTILEDYGHEPLPKYVEPLEGPVAAPDVAEDYPLVFNSGARPHNDFRSQHHGVPGLVEDTPEPTVEINLEDATERGIRNGDLVEVATRRGAVPFRAIVTDRIVRGAIEANMGGGTAVGPRLWREWNVNVLTDLDNYDEISGFPVYKALLCEVTKLEDGTDTTPRSSSAPHTHGSGSVPRPMSERSRIYLDNNATTEIADEVREAMAPYLATLHGNPSSIHRTGRDAREAIVGARRRVARLINARPRSIVFTGGGSEADNLAVKGVAFRYADAGRHLITTTIEHPAILRTTQFLERIGFEVTRLDVDEWGRVDPDHLVEGIRDDTILVSIMMANNEVGTIQPIRELCHIAHDRGVLFHTDAVQAVGKIPVDVEDLDVDLLSIAAHKFHGPKGVGALYVRKGVELEALIHGGKQEGDLRAGTENVPAIVGMGRAAALAPRWVADGERLAALRDRLEEGVRCLVPGAERNGDPVHRLPNTLNLTLPGLRGESLVVALDQHGIALSSGSACKTGNPDPTHVLIAMGKTTDAAHCAVRFSLSHHTTDEDIDATVNALAEVLDEMETTVRFLSCK